MAQPFDIVISGDIVTATQTIPSGYVAARGGRVAAFGAGPPPAASTHFDYPGCLILPGLVDGHMHTGSAIGFAGIEGATRSAAAGGITTCVDMPYDVPRPVTDTAILAEKIGWIERTAHVDVALYGTIPKAGGLGAIAELAAAGITAFKLSTYEYDPVRFPRIDPARMLAAFTEIAQTGLPVALHNEDQELVDRLVQQANAAGETAAIMHCRTRPPVSETLADLQMFEIGLSTGAQVHIAHSSLPRGFELARLYRGMGGRASGEACIHYLCMTEADLVRLGGLGKCNPPFRTAEEVEGLWTALLAGEIAYVSTDHSPWPIEEKTRADIFACRAGLTGLQSFAPLFYTLLVERGLAANLMALYAAERSARFHGLFPRKGSLAIGADCDVLVLERGQFVFDQARIEDRAPLRHSAFHGRAMRARVAATFLRGTQIWDGAEVLARPGSGRFLPRQAIDSGTG